MCEYFVLGGQPVFRPRWRERRRNAHVKQLSEALVAVDETISVAQARMPAALAHKPLLNAIMAPSRVSARP